MYTDVTVQQVYGCLVIVLISVEIEPPELKLLQTLSATSCQYNLWHLLLMDQVGIMDTVTAQTSTYLFSSLFQHRVYLYYCSHMVWQINVQSSNGAFPNEFLFATS